MQGKASQWIGIVLSILSLIIGLAGSVVVIGTAEGINYALYAMVSVPFMLFAGFFSYLAPRAYGAIAICMVAPIFFLGLLGLGMGLGMLIAAVVMAMLISLSASLGARLRTRKAEGLPPPPQDPPSS